MNAAGFMGEGMGVEAYCNNKNCEAPKAPMRLRAVLVPQQGRPQNLVPAIQLQATKEPPYVKNEAGGVVANPKFDPMNVVPLVTWEIVEEFCNNQDCFHNIMDKMWRLGQQKLKVLWGSSC